MPTADTPVPRQLSEEERALWEKAQSASTEAWEAGFIQRAGLPTIDTDSFSVAIPNGEAPEGKVRLVAICGSTVGPLASQSMADAEYIAAANPAVILSLLTALSSEREAGERDKARLDWMQDRPAEAWPVFDMDPEAEVGFRVRCPDTLESGEGATLRDAIDAAIATSTEPAHD